MNLQQTGKAKRADTRIILPTLLAVVLFVISIFVIIIPALRTNIMERKREMIRELTNTAWSVLQEYADEVKKGNLNKQEAQKRAVSDIRYLRYGAERKDYFWITDMQPVMIMHPYKPQLEGKDLSGKEGEDPTGKKIFVEIVTLCKKQDGGFTDYMWQWKDDPSRIVPKLSYVKGFKPWNWVIGTGIYVEDVKQEIRTMTGRLITVSIVIIIVIALLLLYITRESLKLEDRRIHAEQGLRESEKKYRALVEASTQGTMMVREGRYIYSNQAILDMLGYSAQEFVNLPAEAILAQDEPGHADGSAHFKTLLNGGDGPNRFEARLSRKDLTIVESELMVSAVHLGEDKGFIIIARDIGSHKQMEEELDHSREKFKILSDSLNLGVFRSRISGKGRFVEVNPAAVRLLGYRSREELLKINIFDLFYEKEDRVRMTRELLREGSIKESILELKKPDGDFVTLSISGVLVKDENDNVRYCDGTISDITRRKRMEESREDLIVQLQTAQLYYNRPIKHFLKDVPRCSMDLSIRKAAEIMTRSRYSAVLVTAGAETEESPPGTEDHRLLGTGRAVGIVTDRDLRVRVVSEGFDPSRQLYEIMSSPLVSVPDSALIFEALLLMQEKGVRHLAVKNHAGKVVGIINDQQLLHLQSNSSGYLIREIREAREVEDIAAALERLPRLAQALIAGGAVSENICRIFSTISDAVTERLLYFAVAQQGPPPAAFAFTALGSDGREEQTLKTDQDNAIIYDDIQDPDRAGQVREYFLELGAKINGWLDQCGYKLCEGDVMARNPRWCQPLSGWKTHFENWIHAAAPQDLLEVNIFFDFRCVYGERELTHQLRRYIDQLLSDRPEFFQFMARNALLYKPPLGFFGKIVTESTDAKSGTFDIKDAMRPIVNFARLYALKHNIDQTNTRERLHRLYTANVLTRAAYDEIVKVYEYLMQMRFKHQGLNLTQNREADNFINPGNLTEIEHTLLKNMFAQINNFQKRLSYDFTGSA